MKGLFKGLRVLAAVLMLLSSTPFLRNPQTALAAPDPNAAAIKSQLQNFATLIRSLAGFDKLGQYLPLTGFDPTSEAGTRIDQLFDEIKTRVGTFTDNALSDIANGINGLDGDYSGVQLSASGPAAGDADAPIVQTNGSNSNLIDVQFELHAVRTVSVPFDFAQPPVSLDGGSASVTFDLDTVLQFQLDTSVADPLNAFYLVKNGGYTPKLTLKSTASAAVAAFASQLGFTDITASGNSTLNIVIDTTVNDPDSNGKITVEEWINTSIADLFDTNFVDGPGNDVSISLTLAANVGGTPLSGTLSVTNANLAASTNLTPTITLGGLADFANMSTEDMLQGIALFAGGIFASQGVGDLKIPFTDSTLSDAFGLGKKLLDFAAKQADALVLCGTTDGLPPKGSVRNLADNEHVFCRAITNENPTSVTWTVANGDGLVNANSTSTVGLTPGQSFQFDMTAAGKPDLKVDFTFPDASTHSAKLRFLTLQELLTELKKALGIATGQNGLQSLPDDLGVSYDSGTKTLKYTLTLSETAPYTGTLDFSSQLTQTTGLVGLTPDSGASLAITPSAGVSITFGAILVSDVADITPDDPEAPSQTDRFFVQVDNGTNKHEFEADALLDANIALKGHIGFLEVGVTGDPASNPGGGGAAFTLGKVTGKESDPMLAIDINAPAAGIPVRISGNNVAVPNAIRLRELIPNIASKSSVQCNAKVSAGLKAEAKVGTDTPTTLAGGTIGISWPDVFGNDCTPDLSGLNVTPSANYNQDLLSFNLDDANPMRLLSLLLDNLNTIADSLASLPGIDQEVPIVKKKVSDLLRQAALLKNKLSILANGGGNAPGVVFCDTADNGDPNDGGDKKVANVAAGTTIYCRAKLPAGTTNIADVQWTGTGVQFTSGADDEATVGTNPTASAVMNVTDPNSIYKLNVAYKSGTPATSASADYPAVVVPESLQDLEREIEKLTGLPDNAFKLEMKNVDGDTQKELVFRLGYGICTPDFDATLSDCANAYELPDKLAANLNFDIGAGDLVGAQGSGSIQLDFGAVARLNGGIDLNGFISDPGNPQDALFVLNSSKLEVAAKLDTPDPISLSANIGPLVFQAGPGTAKIGADLRVGATGNPTEQNEQIANSLGDLTEITFGGIPGASFDCGNPDGFDTQSAFGCARLPLALNGTPLTGDLALRVTGINPFTAATQVPPDLANQLQNALLSFGMLFNGLNYVLDMAESGLRSKAAESIPFIGKDLAAGADVIQKAQDNVVTPLQDLATRVDQLDGAAIETCTHDILFNALNGGGQVTTCAGGSFNVPGVNLLKDTVAPGGVGPEDIVVTTRCGNDNHDCLSTDGAITVQSIQVEATIGQDATFDIPLDLGFPGLRLRSVTDTIESAVGWQWFVSFKLDRTDGFAVIPKSGANEDEISVTAGLTLPAKSGAELAFLQADITDNHPNDPSLSLTAGVDYGKDPITLANIGNFSIEPSFHADADLDVHIITTLRGGESYGFPSVHTDLVVGWVFDPSQNVQPPSVEFKNVELDAGKFVSQFLAPIVEKVQKLTRPLQPVIDVVSAPIPGLSDLSEAAGGPEITLLSIMKAACGSSCNTQFIDRVIAVITFVNGIDVSAAGSTLVPLGDFKVLGDKALSSAPTPDQALDTLFDPTSPPINVNGFQSSLSNALSSSVKGGPNSNLASAESKAKTGLSFPFLENPKQIFGLLLGQDITLIYADTGFMGLEGGFDQIVGTIMVGPIPVSLGVFIHVKLEARFAVGFDSSGIRKVLTQGSSGEHLFDGIFIDDTLDGKDIAEIQLSGTAGASAFVNLVIVQAGVKVGINLVIGMNLHDDNGDGKLRIDEVFNKLSNPICLFDLEGKLSLFIAVFVKLELFLVSKEWDFVIVDVTLLDFNVNLCAPEEPEPATPVNSLSGDGGIATGHKVLRINVGPFASARKIQTGEPKEDVVVRQIKRCTGGTVNNTGQCTGTVKSGFSVAMFGAYKEYLDVGVEDNSLYAVFANAGGDKDKLSFQAGTDIDGSTPVPFTYRVIAYGGDGDDIIQSGDGNDDLFGDQTNGGGTGADTINGFGGVDKIKGNAGNDNLSGDAGNDIVEGQAGDDSANGGDGNDELYGGDGDDTLGGGKGRDYMIGNTGAETNGDNLAGNEDEDIVVGGNDPGLPKFSTDFFTVAVNNACLATGGSGGPDTIEGGPGNDLLLGGPGNDGIIGGAGDDRLCGVDGNDKMVGDDPNDAAVVGDDRLEGGNGDDDLKGGGNTANVSTNGLDVLLGGNDNDVLYGEAGPDVVIGGNGRDLVTGGPGVVTDLLLGDNATVQGLGGSSAMTYNANAQATQTVTDVAALVSGITAGTDTGTPNCSGFSSGTGTADCVVGSEGNDVLFGEAGNDLMYGDEVNGTGSGQDYMHGNDGADTMRGGGGNDIMFGDNATDVMYGDSGNDYMQGNANDDTMRGGTGDDYMEGNADDNSALGDTMYGDAGQDDMIGGSANAGAPDGGDTMYGNTEHDYMLGDNGKIVRPNSVPNTFDGSVKRDVTLYDVPTAPGCVVAAGGDDEMYGNEANDRMWGQNGNDLMHGNAGDDFIQGNFSSGNGDTLYGDAGQDDLIGGTARTVTTDPNSATNGRCDGKDTIYGGDGVSDLASDFDVIMGDNAEITRQVDAGTGQWKVNTFNAAVTRKVTLFDVAVAGGPAVDAGTSGADVLNGEANDDLMYGQGANDDMSGGNGDDYMEGNAGNDDMDGDGGNDDMVGGTGQINTDTVEGTDGRFDGGEGDGGGTGMRGGTGFDFMAGDNAVVRRKLSNVGAWIPQTWNGGFEHEIVWLRDLATTTFSPAGGTSGNDLMLGDSEDDIMYGQGGNDQMDGGTQQDYMEGNAGTDTMQGNVGQDDITGGTGRINNDPATGTTGRLDTNDFLYGELGTEEGTDAASGVDAMAGDNAIITHPLTQQGQWQTNSFNGAFTRNFWLLDVATLSTPPGNNTSGGDDMYGNSNDDVMYGQGGNDTMHGNAGQDYMEGNSGADTMFGGGNQDDMAGGTGRINSDPATGTAGRLDAGDKMYGDSNTDANTLPTDGHDAMAGDNAIISRPLTAGGAWIPIVYTHTISGVQSSTSRITRDVYTPVDPNPSPYVDTNVSGSDLMRGNGGDDDMYGQYDDAAASALTHSAPCYYAAGTNKIEGDLMCGDAGEDAMLGDNGKITNRAEDGSRTRHIEIQAPFIEEDIFPAGQLSRIVELVRSQTNASGSDTAGGNDVMQGGADGDWMHGGAGYDLINGNGGNDVAFGDDGDDAVWGGTGSDHTYGGYGPGGTVPPDGPAQLRGDYLDIEPRSDDPTAWFLVAPIADSLQDIDIVYGGWGRDAMQADIGGPGPQVGDRLVDWTGAYNIYFTCPGAYGEGVATRQLSPDMLTYLLDQSLGDGALDPATRNSSGFDELGLVYTRDVRENSGPAYPDTPGHFVCPTP